LIPPIAVDHYPPDWHLHRDVERYLDVVTAHAAEVPEATVPVTSSCTAGAAPSPMVRSSSPGRRSSTR
jgi:hypothetical protein